MNKELRMSYTYDALYEGIKNIQGILHTCIDDKDADLDAWLKDTIWLIIPVALRDWAEARNHSRYREQISFMLRGVIEYARTEFRNGGVMSIKEALNHKRALEGIMNYISLLEEKDEWD